MSNRLQTRQDAKASITLVQQISVREELPKSLWDSVPHSNIGGAVRSLGGSEKGTLDRKANDINFFFSLSIVPFPHDLLY
ncbi:unnamed protein product [Clonostachys rosea f. rosea IK726]|uniref:Uncharacterized protein n=1 Tax=Clonostachys rosea f. rosea IK726 TaxID=1349383 RepID=A0ACA9TY43_BIOOC|nr:unnamed protein product [Clonostachys rosea f. rosea IK726]